MYEVEVTSTALVAISAAAKHIAVEALAPMNAQRWLERVWDAVTSLEHFPRRAQLAPEDEYVDYEVRRLRVGSHLLLFTVDDARRTVFIIGLRHGKRLPMPNQLSDGPAP